MLVEPREFYNPLFTRAGDTLAQITRKKVKDAYSSQNEFRSQENEICKKNNRNNDCPYNIFS